MTQRMRIALGSRLYTVVDTSGVYSTVAVFATTVKEAKERGLAVMYGCSLDQVEELSVIEALNSLVATGHNVREFERDDWNMAYAGAEGWVNGLGLKAIPPVVREQLHYTVVGDSRGIEVRFNEDGWFLDIKLPTQLAAAWFVASLPQELSPEFCEALGFVGI